MRIKLIKLIQNELIKIFKRKSIYILLIFSIIAIYIYNNINPDQNEKIAFNNDTKDIPIQGMETALESMKDNQKEYIDQKATIEFWKLYNTFKESSWQRFALKEEASTHTVEGVYTDCNLDIKKYLYNIYDFEYNQTSEISLDKYKTSKIKYNKYVDALNSDDWTSFVNLKIKNLEERKSKSNLSNDEIEEINFEIELYKLRLEKNINYGYNIQNQYLEQIRTNHYGIKSYKANSYNESQAFINKNISEYEKRLNLCKYAIENNIEKDISNEINLIYENRIDARISFIRTFEHFDILLVIIIIYIATTIITEETNKKTIKNLLTKPHKRSTILISKILACIITLIISMIVICIAQYFIGGIIFGFESYDLEYIGYDFIASKVFTMNLFKFIFLTGIAKLPMYIIITLFCIFIGIINNNTSMSMILTLIIFLISNTLLTEWSKVDALSTIGRFFITNNWDFSTYLFGDTSYISGVTLNSSIVIFLIYLLLLLFLSIYGFNKKEIN